MAAATDADSVDNSVVWPWRLDWMDAWAVWIADMVAFDTWTLFEAAVAAWAACWAAVDACWARVEALLAVVSS